MGRYFLGLLVLVLTGISLTGCEQQGGLTSFSDQGGVEGPKEAVAPVAKTVLDSASARKVDAAWKLINGGQALPRAQVDELKEIAKKFPDSSDAVAAVSTTLEKWMDYGGLADFLRSLPPTEERADYLSTVLIKDNQFDAAIDLLRKLLEMNPDNPLRTWRLGYALSFSGKDDEAAPLIRSVVDKLEGEEVVEANNILGQYYLSKDELDQAEACYQKAVASDAKTLQGLMGLATVYERRGNLEKSSVYQNQALTVRNQRSQEQVNNEKFSRLMKELGEELKKKNYSAAEKHIAEMRQIADQDQLVHLDRVQELINQNRGKAGGQRP